MSRKAHGRFSVREADVGELPAIVGVQHDAFGRVARMFDIDPDVLPPLRETAPDLAELFHRGTRFFVAVTPDGSVIGSVRGTMRAGSVEIGRLVVSADWTRQGVATELMDLLERSFPTALRFELFTGVEAEVPLALYAKRGYREYRRESHPGVELVWLEKPGPGAVR